MVFVASSQHKISPVEYVITYRYLRWLEVKKRPASLDDCLSFAPDGEISTQVALEQWPGKVCEIEFWCIPCIVMYTSWHVCIYILYIYYMIDIYIYKRRLFFVTDMGHYGSFQLQWLFQSCKLVDFICSKQCWIVSQVGDCSVYFCMFLQVVFRSLLVSNWCVYQNYWPKVTKGY